MLRFRVRVRVIVRVRDRVRVGGKGRVRFMVRFMVYKFFPSVSVILQNSLNTNAPGGWV